MIPCEDCILIPVCRHKTYDFLFIDCHKLFDKLYSTRVLDMNYRETHYKQLIKEVQKTLKPSRWKLEYFSAKNDVVMVRGCKDEDTL